MALFFSFLPFRSSTLFFLTQNDKNNKLDMKRQSRHASPLQNPVEDRKDEGPPEEEEPHFVFLFFSCVFVERQNARFFVCEKNSLSLCFFFFFFLRARKTLSVFFLFSFCTLSLLFFSFSLSCVFRNHFCFLVLSLPLISLFFLAQRCIETKQNKTKNSKNNTSKSFARPLKKKLFFSKLHHRRRVPPLLFSASTGPREHPCYVGCCSEGGTRRKCARRRRQGRVKKTLVFASDDDGALGTKRGKKK